jgi:hypothetical protein
MKKTLNHQSMTLVSDQSVFSTPFELTSSLGTLTSPGEQLFYEIDQSKRISRFRPKGTDFVRSVTQYREVIKRTESSFLCLFLTARTVTITIQCLSVPRLSMPVVFHSENTVRDVFAFCDALVRKVLRISVSDPDGIRLFRTDDIISERPDLQKTDWTPLKNFEGYPIVFSIDDARPARCYSPPTPRRDVPRQSLAPPLTSRPSLTVTVVKSLSPSLDCYRTTVPIRSGMKVEVLIRQFSTICSGWGDVVLSGVCLDGITLRDFEPSQQIDKIRQDEFCEFRIEFPPPYCTHLVLVRSAVPWEPIGKVYRMPLRSRRGKDLPSLLAVVRAFLDGNASVTAVGIHDRTGTAKPVSGAFSSIELKSVCVYAVVREE